MESGSTNIENMNEQKPVLGINAHLLSTIHRMFRDAQDRLLRKLDCTTEDLRRDITELRNTVSTPMMNCSQVTYNQINKTDDCSATIEDDCSTVDHTAEFLRLASAQQRPASCTTDNLRMDCVAARQNHLHFARNSSSSSTMEPSEAAQDSPFSHINVDLIHIKESVIVVFCSSKKWEEHLKGKWKLDWGPRHWKRTGTYSSMIAVKPIPILIQFFISFTS